MYNSKISNNEDMNSLKSFFKYSYLGIYQQRWLCIFQNKDWEDKFLLISKNLVFYELENLPMKVWLNYYTDLFWLDIKNSPFFVLLSKQK